MKNIVILLLIIFIGAFLRIYGILEYPIQLGHDEISQLYDAISIAETGKDVYGNYMPTMFISVNDFKSPFYTYSTSLVYLLVGNHEWIIKVPGIIFSILIIPAVFFFIKKLFNNEKIAILASLLTAIAPFEIFYGRKSFENIIGIFFLILGFGFLYNYLNNSKYKNFLIGLSLLGIGMYTYFSHAVIIPILLMMYLLINKTFLIARWKKVLMGLFFWGVLILPLLLIITLNPGSRYRSETVFLTQDAELGQKISELEGIPRVWVIAEYSIERYFHQFDLEYLFLNGLDLTHQGPLGSGPLMVMQFPFILLGIFYLIRIKKFKKEKLMILSWILIGMIPSALTFEKFSPHRSIMVFTMLNIICALGIYQTLIFFKEKFPNYQKVIFLFISITFLFNLIYFINVYTLAFPVEKSQEIHYPFKQLSQFAKEKRGEVDQIIFDPKFGEVAPRIGTAAHYYMAYYGDIPVDRFQVEYRLGDQSRREVLFDKYSIRAINWGEDSSLKNVILIASPWVVDINGIDKSKIIKTFYFANKQVAFYAIKL